MQCARNFLPISALLFRNGEIHRPDHCCGRIDGHGSGDVGEWNLIEKNFHVRQGTDCNAAFADFAFRERMVGVVAHQRGQVESCRKSRLALRKQIAKALVCVFSRAETGKLAHRPEAAAVHRCMNSARVRRFAGLCEVSIGVPSRQIRWSVKPSNRMTGNRSEFSLALRIFRQSRLKRVLFPCFFAFGRLTPGGQFGEGRSFRVNGIGHYGSRAAYRRTHNNF